MESSRQTITVRRRGDERVGDHLRGTTPAERLGMVWPLMKAAGLSKKPAPLTTPTRLVLNPDYRDMLSAFAAEEVEYLLIGAYYAMAVHGEQRYGRYGPVGATIEGERGARHESAGSVRRAAVADQRS